MMQAEFCTCWEQLQCAISELGLWRTGAYRFQAVAGGGEVGGYCDDNLSISMGSRASLLQELLRELKDQQTELSQKTLTSVTQLVDEKRPKCAP